MTKHHTLAQLAPIWFIICFFAIACENDAKHIAAFSNRTAIKEESIKVESFYSQSGNMKAYLVAPLMRRVLEDTPYIEFTKSLHVDFLNDSTHKRETWLDSKYGKYFENLNKVYLKDSVRVITHNGDTLQCPDLWWDQQKGIFYTHSKAIYKSKDQKLIGNKGMEATQDLKSISFLKPEGNLLYQEP